MYVQFASCVYGEPSCALDMFETETESECCQESDYVDSDVSDNEEDKQITIITL